jgi:hypothetical protein
LSKPKRANWEKWRHIPFAELWQVVALSIGVGAEPKSLDIYWSGVDDYSGGLPDYSDLSEEVDEEFVDRLEIAASHVLNRTLPAITRNFREPHFSEVRLQDFSDWVESASLGWDLPPQFPRKSELNGDRGAADVVTAGGDQPETEADQRAKIEQLAEWIFLQHSQRRTSDDLYKTARRDGQFGTFTKQEFLAAYKEVYITEPRRPPATGWPLRPKYSKRAAKKSSE